MNEFVKLFRKYGYNVEVYGESFIADNGVFCVPFTVKEGNLSNECSAVSFLSSDKESIKEHYKGEKYIGCKVFSDWMNNRLKFTHIGGICNHDHSLFEIESFLKR